MTTESDAMTGLAGTVRSIADAETPATIFKLVVDGSRSVVPRAAIFLIRRGEIHGWGSIGYDEESTRSQQAFRAPAGAGWLGRMAAGGTLLGPRGPGDDDPDFGQSVAIETVGTVVRISQKPIAILVAERKAEDTLWLPTGLEVLVSAAQLRLELNVAMRRLHAALQSRDGRVDVSQAAETVEIEPAAEQVTRGGLDAARRYARLVATDIRLYNEEAVMLGRRNRDLADRLGTHLGRGKETFLRRHAELGPAGLELLHEAYVQVLAAGDASLIPSAID